MAKIEMDCTIFVGKLRSICDRKNDIELNKAVCKTTTVLLNYFTDKDDLIYIINNYLYEPDLKVFVFRLIMKYSYNFPD